MNIKKYLTEVKYNTDRLMEIESTADGVLGIAIWLLLGVVLLGMAVLALRAFIGAVILGVFIYYCSRPIYRRITQFSRYDTLTALATLSIFVTPFLIIFYYTFSTAVQEIQRVIFEYGFSELQPYFSPYINFDIIRLIETPEQLFTEAEGLDLITGMIDYLILASGVIGDALLMVIVMVTTAFYLLIDDHKIREWLESQMEIISHEFTEFADLVDEDLSSIYFGNILNAVLAASIAIGVFMIYDFIAPSRLQLVFPVLLGLLAGVASLIPMIGTKPAYFPATGYLIAVIYFNDFGTAAYAYPIGFFIVSAIIVDFIPDMMLRPHVSGRNIHLGILLLSYISGPLLFGWYGFFLMPLFAVLFQHYYTLIFPKVLRKIVELNPE